MRNSTVFILDPSGGDKSFTYSLPPLEAIKACVIQEVMHVRNFVGREIDVPIKETKSSYIHPFGTNSAVWVRKEQAIKNKKLGGN